MKVIQVKYKSQGCYELYENHNKQEINFHCKNPFYPYMFTIYSNSKKMSAFWLPTCYQVKKNHWWKINKKILSMIYQNEEMTSYNMTTESSIDSSVAERNTHQKPQKKQSEEKKKKKI